MRELDFIKQLELIDIKLNEKQIKQFKDYFELLVSYNEKVNLTALTSEEDVYEKHFYDCLLTSQVHQFDNQKICDVGAGAGFPSVPLKIIYPELEVVIVDSLEKRIVFLNQLFDKLELTNIKAIASRAEDFVVDNRESFDIVMGRAVARLNILDELCLPLVKKNGYFIALKGKQGLIEHEEAIKGINILGAKLIDKKKYHLISDDSTRYFLIYQKINNSPTKYPRHFSQIKKKPL